MGENVKSYAVAKKQLKGSWDKVAYEDNKLQHHKQLIRQSPDVSGKHHEECIEYLNKYVDVKNDGHEQAWVEEPEASNEKYPGKWRLVSNEFTKLRSGMMGIVQTLRYGFNTTIIWDEAMLLNGDNVAGDSAAKDDGIPEKYMVVIFPNMDPEATDALVTAMVAAKSVVAPTIEKQVRAGTWYYIHVRPTKIEDGSQRIICLLAQPQAFLQTYEGVGTPRETDVYYFWNIPRPIAQALVDTEKTGTGTIASANYSTERGTISLIVRRRLKDTLTLVAIQVEDGCLQKVYHDYYYRMKLNADKNGYENEDGTAFDIGTAPKGWIYRTPIVFDDNDGFYRITVIKIEAIEKNPAVASHTIVDNASSSTTRVRYKNIDTLSDIAIATPSDGEIARRSVQLTRFCEYDGLVDLTTAKAGESEFTFETIDGVTEIHNIAWNQSPVGGDPDLPALPADKERRIKSLGRNIDGTWNWWLVTNDQSIGDGYGEANALIWYKRIGSKLSYTWTAGGTIQHLWVQYHKLKVELIYEKTEATAYTHIDFANNPTGVYFGGTEVRSRGKDKWVCQRVTDDGWSAVEEIT